MEALKMATYKQSMMVLWLLKDLSIDETSDLIKDLLEKELIVKG
jgi:hypothetical protein